MNNRKKLLLLLAILGIMLLTACGRSDLTLTVNSDGSFHASISYGITKALVANDEAMSDVKSLITDSLDQNDIPYTEAEDEERVTITVERDFADLSQLTSQEAWKGISFVPLFTAGNDGSGIWTRIEEGRLKFSGTLNAQTFNTQGIIGDMEDTSGFGGSVRIILPQEAEAFSGGQIDGNSYIWSGTGEDSLTMDLVSAPMYEDGGPDGEAAKTGEQAERKTTLRDGIITLLVVLALLAIVAGVVIAARKKNRQ